MLTQAVLVDTSIWIKYFRQGNSFEAVHLDQLIAEDRLVLCDPIKAEILSGVRTIEDYKKVFNWLDGFRNLSLPSNIWQLAAENRFRLAKKGIQQSLIDLMIALTAREHEVFIWSLDKDFFQLTHEISLRIYRP